MPPRNASSHPSPHLCFSLKVRRGYKFDLVPNFLLHVPFNDGGGERGVLRGEVGREMGRVARMYTPGLRITRTHRASTDFVIRFGGKKGSLGKLDHTNQNLHFHSRIASLGPLPRTHRNRFKVCLSRRTHTHFRILSSIKVVGVVVFADQTPARSSFQQGKNGKPGYRGAGRVNSCLFQPVLWDMREIYVRIRSG